MPPSSSFQYITKPCWQNCMCGISTQVDRTDRWNEFTANLAIKCKKQNTHFFKLPQFGYYLQNEHSECMQHLLDVINYYTLSVPLEVAQIYVKQLDLEKTCTFPQLLLLSNSSYEHFYIYVDVEKREILDAVNEREMCLHVFLETGLLTCEKQLLTEIIQRSILAE